MSCTVGEGLECNSFTPQSSDECIQQVTFDFSFENTGSIPLDITTAETQVGTLAPQSILSDLERTALDPDESTAYTQTVEVDFCPAEDQTITTVVRAEATPGPCEDESEYVLNIPGAPAPTPPSPTPPSPTPPPPTSLPLEGCSLSVSLYIEPSRWHSKRH